LCAYHLCHIYSKLSFSLRIPQQNLVCISPLPYLFQVVFFPQDSPTKPCVHLTSYHIYSKWSISLRYPQQNLVCTSLLPSLFHMRREVHHFLFGHPNNIWWELQIMELLTVPSFLLSCYLFPLGPNILLCTLFSNTLRPCSSLSMTDQVSRLL
jgi:hypothetical protein